MKTGHLCGVAIVLGVLVGTAAAAGDVYQFELESKAVAVRYDVEVVIPAGTPAPGTKYPVVYCMDWFVLGDYLKALPKLMDLGHLTEPYILVGITQGKTADDWATMRTRDFTPARPTDEYSRQNTYPNALELAGGAEKFTAFLKDELIPVVESKYPADPTRRCFVGYSLGGLLGVYVLNHEPELFQYYVLGSPSVWFNDFSLGAELAKLPAERLQGIRKAYVSVGEEESWEMLKGFGMVRAAFLEKDVAGAKLKAEVINASGHVGAMPIALYNGLRFVLGSK